MAAGQSFGLSTLAVAVDGADGVDDELRREASCIGDDGFAGSESADFCHDDLAFGENGGTAGAVNSAVDASAAEEGGVRGVDDSVGSFFSDVGGAVEGDRFVGGEEEAHERSVVK